MVTPLKSPTAAPPTGVRDARGRGQLLSTNLDASCPETESEVHGSARGGDFCEVAGRVAGQPPFDGATEVAGQGNLGARNKEILKLQRAAMTPSKSPDAALREQRTRRPRGGATEVVGPRGPLGRDRKQNGAPRPERRERVDGHRGRWPNGGPLISACSWVTPVCARTQAPSAGRSAELRLAGPTRSEKQETVSNRTGPSGPGGGSTSGRRSGRTWDPLPGRKRGRRGHKANNSGAARHRADTRPSQHPKGRPAGPG